MLILYILIGKLFEHKHVPFCLQRSMFCTKLGSASSLVWLSVSWLQLVAAFKKSISTNRYSSMVCCLQWFSLEDTILKNRILVKTSNTSCCLDYWAQSWYLGLLFLWHTWQTSKDGLLLLMDKEEMHTYRILWLSNTAQLSQQLTQ